MKKTAIIVPCYNEESRLESEEFLDFVKKIPRLHFIFVNDGSQDNTLRIIKKLEKKSKQCHVLDLKKNRGKAFAIFSGFNKAFEDNYKNIGFWDADLATPLNMIPKFMVLLKDKKYKAVFGCRVKRLGADIQRHASRHYIGRIMATLISGVLNLGIYDTQCGAKIFRVNKNLKEAFTAPFKSKWIFDVELIARLQKISKGKFAREVYEYPLEIWHDIDGSKIKFRDGFRALYDLIKIKISS